MPFSTVAADLIKILDPGVATTRASWSKMRRPWTPGYRAKARASAAAELKGFPSYSVEDTDHVIRIQGAGAADNATPFTYELAGLTSLSLPTTASLTESEDYLNAVAVVYPVAGRSGGDAALLERLGAGVGNVTRAFWRVTDADTLVVAVGYAGGVYSDLPLGWTMEIQIPTAADIDILWAAAAAGATVVDVADFMASGGTAAAGIIDLDRVFM